MAIIITENGDSVTIAGKVESPQDLMSLSNDELHLVLKAIVRQSIEYKDLLSFCDVLFELILENFLNNSKEVSSIRKVLAYKIVTTAIDCFSNKMHEEIHENGN